MRSALILGMFLAGSTQVLAQLPPSPYPADLTIVAGEVEVRSGPTKQYYPTSKLRAGDHVKVLRESKDQPGWLCIMPPPGSFSWIKGKYVKKVDSQNGYVEGDSGGPVAVMPGSSVVNQTPNVESVTIPSGSLVIILDKAFQAQGETWLPIQPPPTEVRFIPADAVRAPVAAATVTPDGTFPTRVGSTTVLQQAEDAYRVGNVEQAKQLYREAADRTADPGQKAYAQAKYASLSQGGAAWNPGLVNPATFNPGQTTSNFGAGNALVQGARWSGWGTLRRASFDRAGSPVYVLESKPGQPLMYAVTGPGMSLNTYVGRLINLYGPLDLQSNDYPRVQYMTASHVAVP